MKNKESLMGAATDAISQSEITEYLYRYAKKNDIIVTEFKSKVDHLYFAHIEEVDAKSATAVGKDKVTTLLMAFLNFSDPRITFID